MRRSSLVMSLAFGASVVAVSMYAFGQVPKGGGGRPPMGKAGGPGGGMPGGAGGAGGPGGPGGLPIIPPHVEAQLNLTPQQKADLERLQMEVDKILVRILTPEQLQQLRQAGPPMGGPGGAGGPPMGGAAGGAGAAGGPPMGGAGGPPMGGPPMGGQPKAGPRPKR